MWPKSPVIYEINTWTWLTSLGAATLMDVPNREWDALAQLHVDAVWLMGVWQRSPEGVRIARWEQGLEPEFRKALPDFAESDVSGSPYCIRDYVVDERFGGATGLASARRELAERGMRLIVDFVPNHVAPDHGYRQEHPEYLIREGSSFARGRDPYFPPWPDTLQLNAFDPGLRRAMIETLDRIARQADGVRCDMAMLMLNDVFSKTWGLPAPPTEYWSDVLGEIKQRYPRFLFIAEAYWDLEWRLQQLGFDYCYDKRLLDRLEHDGAEAVEGHLRAAPDYQNRLIRFLENHDEPRAFATFGVERQKAAAVVAFTTPGARLIHEGQIDGCALKLPVQLGRRPAEAANQELRDFYLGLLNLLAEDGFRDSRWEPCRREGWPDNQTCMNILAWARTGANNRRWLIIVNYSQWRSQARIRLPWSSLDERPWHLNDSVQHDRFPREGAELASQGLFVDLAPWKFHLLELNAI